MAETVYEMMMKLSLDHQTALVGLGAIGARLVNIATQANTAKAAIMGLGTIAFGGALIYGLTKALETAKEFSKEMTALRNLGGDMEKLVASGAMENKIFDVAKITGQKVEDIAKIAHFTNSILGTEDTVNSLLYLSQYSGLQEGGADKHSIQNLIRSGMITGRITDPKTSKIDMEKLHNFIDEFQRLKSATGGAFNEEVMYGMAKQGGGFLRGLTTEGMEHMAIIAQSLGGPRTGTAFLSIYEQLARGQMTAKTAQGMEDAGLLKHGQWSTGDHGTVILDKEASKALTAKFGGDPLALAKEIRENLIKQGITDPQEQMRITSNAFGRQTSRRFMAEEVADYEQMIGEGKRLGQAAGVDKTLENKMAHDMAYNLERVQNAWHNLMVAFSASQADNFIMILHTLERGMISLTDSIRNADPETLKGIADAMGTVNRALIAVGEAFRSTGKDIEAVLNILRKGGAWLRWIDEKTSIKDIPSWVPFIGSKPKAENQSYEGDGFNSDYVRKTSFNPSNSNKQILQPVTISLNLDGRMLGQAVSEILEDLYEHPNSPPAANSFDHMRQQGAWGA